MWPQCVLISSAPESDFYSTLWSLQQYFASPPSLDGPATKGAPGQPPRTPFEQFKIKSDFVLPRLFEQTTKEKEMMGREAAEGVGRKRKRSDTEGQDRGDENVGFFHPRYLTGKKLLEHEVCPLNIRADSARRT
jgi:THO complex subunit 1